MAFAEYVSPWFDRQPHLDLLESLIVRLMADQLTNPKTGKVIRRLAVSIPPRHGKSETISSHTPAWLLCRNPNWRIMLASYEADFAASWGRKARQHIADHPEFGITLSVDSKSAKNWNLAPPYRGGMVTAGIGGPATGKGANLLIIDDYLKNSDEAQSGHMRDKQWDWWTSVAKTRLEPGGYVIVLATRWHEDDLIGRFTEQQGDRWHYINLPALAEEDDPLGRKPGEALCPAWYDEDALAEARSDEVDGRWFSAQYQGHPTTLGGGLFREANFRYWQRDASHYILPSRDGLAKYVKIADCMRFCTVDLAATLKTTSDFSIIATWDVTPARELLLVDRVRVRIESSEHREWLVHHYRRVEPRYAIVEAKTYGLPLLQGGYKDGLVLRPGNVKNIDKVARAIPAGSAIDGGRIYFPSTEFAPWVPEFTSELLRFPNSRHDDQVDALSMAAEEITTGALAAPVLKKEPEPTTLEGRLARYMAQRRSGNRNQRHPELGKV